MEARYNVLFLCTGNSARVHHGRSNHELQRATEFYCL
jgi:protein-tyrosine-phosphatase